MKEVVKEYEKTISELIADNKREKTKLEVKMTKLEVKMTKLEVKTTKLEVKRLPPAPLPISQQSAILTFYIFFNWEAFLCTGTSVTYVVIGIFCLLVNRKSHLVLKKTIREILAADLKVL